MKKSSSFRFWPSFASLLLFAGVCAIAAYWALQLTAPSPAVAPAETQRTDARGGSDPRALASLFGVPAAAVSAPVAVVGDIQVVGITAGDSRASAILAVDGAPARFYSVGAMVTNGVKLVAVKRDAVVVERNGARSELPAPLKRDLSVLTSGAGKARTAGASGPPPTPGAAPMPVPPHGAAAAAATPAPVSSAAVPSAAVPPPAVGVPAGARPSAPDPAAAANTTPGNVFIPNVTIGGSPSNMPAPNTALPASKSPQ